MRASSPSTRRHLGLLVSSNGEDNNGWIQPLAVLSNGRWVASPLPNTTLVCWPNLPTTIRPNTIWLFSHKNEAEMANPEKSAELDTHFYVSDEDMPPEPAVEVRFRSVSVGESDRTLGLKKPVYHTPSKIRGCFDALEAIRRDYFDIGTSVAPLGPLIVSVPEHLHIGPLDLYLDESKYWKCAESMVHYYPAIDKNRYDKVNIGGIDRDIWIPRPTRPQPIGSLDFSPDSDLLNNWISEDGELTDELRETLLSIREKLFESSTVPAAEFIELRIMTAIERMLDKDKTKHLVRQTVLEMPAIKQVVEYERKCAFDQAMREAESALLSKKQEQERLSRAVEITEALLVEARSQLTAAHAETVRELGDQMVNSVKSATLAMLSDIARVRETSGTREHEIHGHSLSKKRPPLLFTNMDRRNGVSIESLSDLSKCLRADMKDYDLSPLSSRQLIAAWLAGVVPFVVGDGGGHFLQVIAARLTGKRQVHKTISGSVANFSDLFGQPHPMSGRYLPDPSGLADIFVDDGGFDRLHLVVFEGVGRCDTESVFSPLLDAYTQTYNDERHNLNVLHPYSLSSDEPYHKLSSATWRLNLLPALRYTASTYGLQASPAFLRRVALIQIDSTSESKVDTNDELFVDTWIKILTEAKTNEYKISAGAPTSMSDRYDHALKLCGMSPEQANASVTSCMALPALVASGARIAEEQKEAAEKIQRCLFGNC